MTLTPKREKFAQCVASGMNQSDAYREAFDTSKTQPHVVNIKASQLMAIGMVRLRVEELRKPAAEKSGITLESHLSDLQYLRDKAEEAGQLGAAITAEIARGKASGVVAPEKREHTGKGGAPIAVTAVSPDEYRRIALEIAGKT